ncbi:uncharacterized protein EV420DRAFT_1542013 [Desarmillaria tabescens]|uniref:Uncharacterized protein n=1 Tax=Armillaria tabescens TaxID=1929756 RepID=A0AA39KC11_ARMTA|nr:uncharacterized protein EV420DRAFT_1542013 [Desarmillaria tabescens]KAK0458392.1 hypothetical protein EV420DRAFT_1542013 [Desarmillaria tabescens]
MSSVILPSRGKCIQVIDSNQYCQCLWFFPPESPLLDQNICSLCGHGIYAHVDYVSMVVHHCFATNCAAYFPKTARVQACTCSAYLIDHKPVRNAHRSPTPLPYGADASIHDNGLPSNVNTSTGDTMNISFTPIPMPSPSTNINPSYSYGDTMIFTSTPQPVIQMGTTQIDAYSRSEVENSYITQYQDHNSSVNVQDPNGEFREDYLTISYNEVHGTGSWAGQLE